MSLLAYKIDAFGLMVPIPSLSANIDVIPTNQRREFIGKFSWLKKIRDKIKNLAFPRQHR